MANKNSKINTWAIFWYATIFKQNGLCLNPTRTFVDNIGLDGSGIHCGISNCYMSRLSVKQDMRYNINIQESLIALERIQKIYKSQKKAILLRVLNKLTRIILRKNIL